MHDYIEKNKQTGSGHILNLFGYFTGGQTEAVAQKVILFPDWWQDKEGRLQGEDAQRLNSERALDLQVLNSFI